MIRRDYAIAAVILALAILAAFGTDLFSGRFLFLRYVEDPNNVLSFYPWDIFSAQAFRSGRFPLFNPFNACGVPHLANYQSAPLYPLHLLLFLHPTRLAFDLFLLARFFILGYGTYFLARRLGLRNMPAVGAMLAAAFSGYYMRYAAMVHLNVEVLLPWAMWLAIKIHEERRFRDWACLALLMAAGMVGGNAESAFFLALIVALWAVWLKAVEGGSAWILTLTAIAASGLFSVAQVLPFLEYLPHAWHIHPEGIGAEWLSPSGLYSLAAPHLFGGIAGLGPYLGGTVIMLAVVGSARDKRTWFFFVMAVFLLALIYGPPGTKWLTHLPGFSRSASYKYAFGPLGILLAVLAGRGIESIIAGEATPGRVRRAAVAIAIFVGFFIAGGWIAGQNMHLWSAAAAIVALGMAAAASPFPKFRSAAIVAVLWLELIAHSYGMNPKTLLIPDQIKNSPQVANLIEHRNSGRVAASLESGLPSNLNLLWGISDVGLFDALYPKTYVGQMSKALNFSPGESTKYFKTHAYAFPISPGSLESPVWRDLGVRYYLGRDLKPQGMEQVLPYLWEDRSAKSPVDFKTMALEPFASDCWRHNFGKAVGPGKLIARYNRLPGWRAWINETEVFIEKAEGMFMAVDIPPDGGNVRFSYAPWGWRLGLWVTLGSLISLTGWVIRNIFFKRKAVGCRL